MKDKNLRIKSRTISKRFHDKTASSAFSSDSVFIELEFGEDFEDDELAELSVDGDGE